MLTKNRLQELLRSELEVSLPINDPLLKESSVLIIIYYLCKIPHIILTKRSHKLRKHPGEISFPGGNFLREDKNLLNTAIRETFEEIGITIPKRFIVGRLHSVNTLTSKYIILPYVAILDRKPLIVKVNLEVEKIFDVPLFDLLNTLEDDLENRKVDSPHLYKFTYNGEVIWGATARIIEQLFRLINTNLK